MTDLKDSPAIRRLHIAALVAAPLAGLATTVVWPQTPIDVAGRLDVLAAAPARTQIAHLLNLLTILLFVPALAGMHRLLQPRRPRAAAAGAALVRGARGMERCSRARQRRVADREHVAGRRRGVRGEALQSSPVAIAMTAMFLLCTFIGLVVLAVALWRA